mmetsp:Transcript_1270/g.2993  ORF Transcript_1270/g.2993 Transcript_1270/m.2993 type:complete len:209 (+) Transcript_1270:576-1202(+)
MTSVFNDGNDVGTCLGNVEEVTTGTVREFNGVDCSFGSDNVGNVGDGGSCSCSEVENFGAWFDPNIVDTTENGSSDLGPERIPNPVLNLGSVPIRTWRSLHTYPLFTIHSHTRRGVKGDKCILLSTSDEYSLVTMGFDDDLGSSLHSSSSSTTTSSSASASTTSISSTSSSTTSTSSSSPTTVSSSSSTTPPTGRAASKSTASSASSG